MEILIKKVNNVKLEKKTKWMSQTKNNFTKSKRGFKFNMH